MTGIEIVVGYVFAHLVGKAKRVSRRADTEVDRALDAGMDRLHDLVSRKLGQTRRCGGRPRRLKTGLWSPRSAPGAD